LRPGPTPAGSVDTRGRKVNATAGVHTSRGLLPAVLDGYEDDALYAKSVGFTDLIKRPTARASRLGREESDTAARSCSTSSPRVRPRLVIFTYKRVAQELFECVNRPGVIPRQDVLPTDGFLMPGPYERADRVGSC
jgi:hypothetical protein